jgi:hypothetical protein
MVPLIAFICFLEFVRQRKKFSNWKNYVFLFQVFDLRFFTKFFILKQCLDPNPNPTLFPDWIQPNYSHSGPQHCPPLPETLGK